MKKITGIKILLVLMALVITAVPASADASAGRVLSASISPGSNLQVTINVAGYGAGGQVLEKIPSGFTLVSTTHPYYDVLTGAEGDVISFTLLDESSINYIVKAPTTKTTYKFVGILRYNITDNLSIPDSSITVKSSSGGGHSSSGGGGGAGGSPEAQSNVEVKELSRAFVSNGKHVKFEFSQGVTCIQYVEFDALKTAGKITAIAEMLKGQSGLVSDMPAGTVYKSVNLWVGSGGFASSENIEKPAIGFKVEKAWLKENGFEASDIAIWHYADSWEELETQKTGEDDTHVYFKAGTPGLSPFAIIAKGETAQQIDEGSEILPLESATGEENSPAAEPEKISEEEEPSGMPGFEAILSVGIIGAVYCVLRRKQ